MSNEFRLRVLCYEAWADLGPCGYDALANEVLLRISASDRETALSEAVLAYSRDFAARHRPDRVDRATLRERLERRTERVGDCLLWTGKTDGNGYAAITIWSGEGRRTRRLSRVSHEEFIGPIPDGYDVDHACHSRDPDACPGRPNCLHIRCWNPEHLQAVTHAENMRRRKSWRDRKVH